MMNDDEDLIYDQTLLLKKETKASSYSKWCQKFSKTMCLSLAFFTLGLCIAIPGPTLLDLGDKVNTDTTHMALIFSARSIGYLLGALIGGFLFDIFDKQLMLTATLFVAAVATVIIPWSATLVILAVMFSLQGVAMGVLDTGGNVFCVRLWGGKSPPYMQALHFAFGIGAFVAPLIAQPFLSSTNVNGTSPLQGYLPVVKSDAIMPIFDHNKTTHILVRRESGDFIFDNETEITSPSNDSFNNASLAGNLSVISTNMVTTPTTTTTVKQNHKPVYTDGGLLRDTNRDGGQVKDHLQKAKTIDELEKSQVTPKPIEPYPTPKDISDVSQDKNETKRLEPTMNTPDNVSGLGNLTHEENSSLSNESTSTEKSTNDVKTTLTSSSNATTTTSTTPKTTTELKTTTSTSTTTTTTTTMTTTPSTMKATTPSTTKATTVLTTKMPTTTTVSTTTSPTTTTTPTPKPKTPEPIQPEVKKPTKHTQDKNPTPTPSTDSTTTNETSTGVSLPPPKTHKPTTTSDLISTVLDSIKNMSRIQFAYSIIGVLLFVSSTLFLVSYCFTKRKPDFEDTDEFREVSMHAENNCVRLLTLVFSFFFFFCYVGMETTFGGLIMTFAVEFAHWTKSQGAIVTSIFWGSLAVGRGFAIFISNCCKPKTMLIIDLVIMMIGALILAFGVQQVKLLLWLGTVFLGIGLSSVFPTSVTWIEQYFKITGKSTAVFVTGSAIGQMTLPVVTGYLYENYNKQYLMYVVLLLGILMVILYIIMQCLASRGSRTMSSGFLRLDDLDTDVPTYSPTNHDSSRRKFMPVHNGYDLLMQDAEEEF